VPSLPKLEEECFFIAPIGQDGSEERKRSDGVLEFIVARAAEELGLQAVRADQLAEPGQITLQVIEHVLGAKAAVADLTGHNPNVYYELAIRHTAKLPTVLIAEQGQRLPFDIAQMRTIFFSHTDLRSADRCRTDIVRHLQQALDGAVDSPVAASVDLQRLQAGNTVERSVAELVTNVGKLDRFIEAVYGDVRQLRRNADRQQVWSDQMLEPLQATAQHLNAQLDDLLHIARERNDVELEDMVQSARGTGLGLVLGFPARLSGRHGSTGRHLTDAQILDELASVEPARREKMARELAARQQALRDQAAILRRTFSRKAETPEGDGKEEGGEDQPSPAP
jgi:hypothetical protein